MNSMRVGIGVAASLLAAPGLASAQSTFERIQAAIAHYEAFNVEAARPLLQLILSASYTQQVSSQEKALALKYLGASYAVLEKADSATQYFMGALDYDPFTDLDPTKFAASELAAFSEAKRRLFKVAIRPLPAPSVVHRDTAAIRFDIMTTQPANIVVELTSPRDTIVLLEGRNDGARAISWRGVMSTGGYAPPGTYQLRVRGTPSRGGQQLSESMTLRIEHIFEPLEDTLDALDPARDLLPERIRATEPWVDLIKGASLAAAAVTIPLIALDKNDISWAPHAGVTAFVGLSSASISFWYRRTRPQIRGNVIENDRRRMLRANFNSAVRSRNQERLDRTILVVSPVATFGQ